MSTQETINTYFKKPNGIIDSSRGISQDSQPEGPFEFPEKDYEEKSVFGITVAKSSPRPEPSKTPRPPSPF